MSQFTERFGSQMRAVVQLVKMGWRPIGAGALGELRDGSRCAVLKPVLRECLMRINKIEHRGTARNFTDEAISYAVDKLMNESPDGLMAENKRVFEHLVLGVSVSQTIDGDKKSYQMKFIDFETPENNTFNVAWEVKYETVSSARSNVRLDIVLFINGIPVAQIENKAPTVDVLSACEQMRGYQHVDCIPYFYRYVQLLIAANGHKLMYGVIGTPKNHYAHWIESGLTSDKITSLWRAPIGESDVNVICGNCDECGRKQIMRYVEGDVNEQSEDQQQDRGIYSLLSKDRILYLIRNFIIFDGNNKKICRYQQFFAVKKIEERIANVNEHGKRDGGLVWHTQGSGKSLTMAMTVSMIFKSKHIKNPKVVIVTDRIDLDEQIKSTFNNCGFKGDVKHATSGNGLIGALKGDEFQLVTTTVQKFSDASNKKDVKTSPNVFVLIDEGHRTQNGLNHANMKKALPNACYIGFTGTPLMKAEKNTEVTFGGMIDKYTIDQAIKDGAVVKLMYEGRHVEQSIAEGKIDDWFGKACNGLSDTEKADLKKKFAKAKELQKTERSIFCTALDIVQHFKNRWKIAGAPTQFKAQLVAPNKHAAILYKKYIDEICREDAVGDTIRAEVIISSPDLRECDSYDDEDFKAEPKKDGPKKEIAEFWNSQMKKYGDERKYNADIIDSFKKEGGVEILIVVDKLLTGFDAPRNRTLYVTRGLQGHTLLQAIARVNRTMEGKDEGYIVDYANILGNLDKAITDYSSLSDFNGEDLRGVLFSIRDEIATLPDALKTVKAHFVGLDKEHASIEGYEEVLSNEVGANGESNSNKRKEFYSDVSRFAKVLTMALSCDEFNRKTSVEDVEAYKDDMRFFMNLRESVKQKFADVVSYKEYEDKIRFLLNQNVEASNVIQVVSNVDIFNESELSKALERKGSDRAKADLIMNNLQAHIDVNLQEQDPALHEKFSKMIRDAIEDAKHKRLSESEYLFKAGEIKDAVASRKDGSIPYKMRENKQAHPFYRALCACDGVNNTLSEDAVVEACLSIYDILKSEIIVDWKSNDTVQNKMKNKISDYLYDNAKLDNADVIDKICNKMIELAKINF